MRVIRQSGWLSEADDHSLSRKIQPTIHSAHVLNQNYVKCSKNCKEKKQRTEQIEIKLKKWEREYVHKSNAGIKQKKNNTDEREQIRRVATICKYV